MIPMANQGSNDRTKPLGGVVPPPAADDPFPLPDGVELRLEGDLPLTPPIRLETRDRGEDIQAAARVAWEERRLTEQDKRIKEEVIGTPTDLPEDGSEAGTSPAPANDSNDSPEKMASYWVLIPEVEPPKNRTTFKRWQDCAAALKEAFPVLLNSKNKEPLRLICLGLMGITNHVPLDRFESLVAQLRNVLSKPAPPEPMPEPKHLAIEQTVDGGERLLTTEEVADLHRASDALAATLNQAQEARALGQAGDEWDVDDPTGRVGLGRARPGDEFSVRHGSPVPFRIAPVTASTPAPATASALARKKTARNGTSLPRAILGVSLFLVLSLLALSVSYLYGDSKTVKKEIQHESRRNDDQDLVIRKIDNRTADLVTAILTKEREVVDLRRQKDGYESLARDFNETRKGDATTILRANSELKADISRIRNDLTATKRELDRLRDELKAREEDKTPATTP